MHTALYNCAYYIRYYLSDLNNVCTFKVQANCTMQLNIAYVLIIVCKFLRFVLFSL